MKPFPIAKGDLGPVLRVVVPRSHVSTPTDSPVLEFVASPSRNGVEATLDQWLCIRDMTPRCSWSRT